MQKSCRILFVECFPREPQLGLSQGGTLFYQNSGLLVLQSEYFALWNGGTGSQDVLSVGTKAITFGFCWDSSEI